MSPRPIRNAVTLVVDGREVVAPEGTMLVDAAKGGDVEIPVFCYDPKLGQPVGACRMCLVEIEGIPKLQTACSTPVRDGMVVYTQTDHVKEAQNAVVEFLLVNHPLDCPVCDKGGECPLQDIAMGWGPGRSRFTDPKRHFQKPLDLSPLIAIDRERCILCYRCVRFSQEVAEDEQLQLLERGDKSFVGTFDDRPYIAPFHGNITELCPVGALTSYTYRFKARPWDIEDAGSVCTLCPSQCNVTFTVRDEHVLRVLARDNTAVDDGWLCDKGRFAFQMFNSADRITRPMVRAGDGSLSPVSWDDALAMISKRVRASGARSAALLGGGASNEEGWLAQRIVRTAGGSSVDSSPSPVDSELLAELSRPELSARVEDLDYAGAILVIGTDPLHEMPILDLRIRKAVRRGGAQLMVASERPTALDGGAAAESARYGPGEATAFLRALAGGLGADGYERADGHEAKHAAGIAKVLNSVPDPVIVWGERLWRSPGAVEALRDCARAIGMHNRIGPGLLEVPEEANGRGLREVGCLPAAGPGFGPATAGRDAAAIREGLASHELDTLLLIGADPVRTHPDGDGWRRALAGSFVVAASMFDDESTRYANVVLPAESHAEKEGTVTHPEGRLQRLRPNVPHPEGVRPVWWALSEVLTGVGGEAGFGTPEDVFAAVCAEVPFYGATAYEEIGGQGLRWQERDPGASWKPGDGGGGGIAGDADSPIAPSGSEEAAAAAYASPSTPPPPTADGQDGLVLGTYRDLWATDVTKRNPALRFLMPKQKLEVAAKDAEELELANGDEVTVSVNGSSVEARVAVRERMRPGAAFLIEGTDEANANVLTNGTPQRIQVVKR
ncbi:MAG TPA: NADH-quinone oxidoreductase subunit NuoG [Solirubrobacterales bacterium]|jgi:NADH-quinone oxidoreductase subunit G|nr:NADH-quinone oxidoreductase subunit NuoG [Solirubrobacterales bacterium]